MVVVDKDGVFITMNIYSRRSILLEKIYPSSGSKYTKKMSSLEVSMMGKFPSISMHYSGWLNYKSYKIAIEKTLKSFDFLFCKINKKDDGYYYEYDSNDNSYFIAIEKLTLPLKKEDITSMFEYCLDKQSDFGRSELFPCHKKDESSIKIKVIFYQGGFSISFSFNHAFLDLSGVMFFWTTVAANYRKDKQLPQPPELVDVMAYMEESFKEEITRCPRVIDVQSYAKRFCKYYIGINKLINEKVRAEGLYLLKFNSEQLRELSTTGEKYISRLDVVNAILIKIFISDHRNTSNPFTYGFSRNIRGSIGLDSKHIGNFVDVVHIKDLDSQEVDKLSLIALAEKIRSALKDTDGYFYDYINWIRNVDDSCEEISFFQDGLISAPRDNAFTSSFLIYDKNKLSLGSDSDFLFIEAAPPHIYSVALIIETFFSSEPTICVLMRLSPERLKYAQHESKKTNSYILQKINS